MVAGDLSEGMLPNRFPDRGETPEFNAVDASLWFVVAVYELFDAAARCGRAITSADRDALEHAVDEILGGYAHGTRFGIHADTDGHRCCVISTRPDSGTSRRSPMAMPRTRQTAARSRHGLSARQCVSTGSCWHHLLHVTAAADRHRRA